MISPSTQSMLSTMLSALSNGNTQYAKLSQQLASGVKSSDLADYTGTQASRLVNAQTQTTRLTAFNSSIDLVSTRLNSYSTIYDTLDELATNAVSALTNQSSYDADDLASVKSQINTALAEVSSLLNEQVGGRYLFGGANYSTQPVKSDLTGSNNPFTGATAASFTPVTEKDASGNYNVTSYSTIDPAASESTKASAWYSDKFSPEQNKTVSYGMTATDPALQNLIAGLQQASAAFTQAAAQDTDEAKQATYTSYRDAALTTLKAATDGLTKSQTAISLNLSSISDSKDLNTSLINVLATDTTNISGVDQTEVAVKINSLETQLEASYQVTAGLKSLSLVNYL